MKKKYLVPAAAAAAALVLLAAALCTAARSGVDVRILTPHIPDKKVVFAVTQSNYPVLLEAGVRIYEFTPGFLHSKTVVADDLYASVGSCNLDYRSFYLQFENGVWLCGDPAVFAVRDDFLLTLEVSQEITLDDGRTCRLGFAEVGSWDFGQTQVGQVDRDGTPWVLAVNKSTMHGVLQIKVDAGYDDLVLYYNAQGFGENDVFSYDVWAGDGEDGPLYLDELGYFKGMQGMRFYRLDELVSLFAEGA